MKRELETAAGTSDFGWTRVSSFKPQLAAFLLTAIGICSFSFLLGAREETLPLAAAGTAVGLGLIALNCKVVHQRGNDFRVSTLFYSEVVTVDDVCMTVPRPGPLWSRCRIHLRRPARFGWTITFVPTGKALALPAARPKPAEA